MIGKWYPEWSFWVWKVNQQYHSHDTCNWGAMIMMPTPVAININLRNYKSFRIKLLNIVQKYTIDPYLVIWFQSRNALQGVHTLLLQQLVLATHDVSCECVCRSSCGVMFWNFKPKVFFLHRSLRHTFDIHISS